jgi:hypothetical protein
VAQFEIATIRCPDFRFFLRALYGFLGGLCGQKLSSFPHWNFTTARPSLTIPRFHRQTTESPILGVGSRLAAI